MTPSRQLTLLPDPPTHGFDDFWSLCPKKADKDSARRAFDKVIRARRATLPQLCEAMARYAEERDGKDPQFTKYPASWLNAGSWKNDSGPSYEGGSYRDVLEEIR